MKFSQVLSIYFRYATKDRAKYIITLGLTLLIALVNNAYPIVIGLIVDALAANSDVFAYIVILFALPIIGGIFNALNSIFGSDALFTATKACYVDYLSSIHQMDVETYTNGSTGRLISKQKRGDGAFYTAFFELNNRSAVIVIGFVLAMLALSSINLIFGLLIALAILYNVFTSYFLIKMNIAKRREANSQDDKLKSHFVDNILGYMSVKIFGQEDYEKQRFRTAFIPWIKAQIGYVRTFNLIDMNQGLVSSAILGGLMLLTLHELSLGLISIGTVATAFTYALRVNDGLNNIVYRLRDMAKVYTDLVDYFKIIISRPKMREISHPKMIENAQGNIELQNVDFSYAESEVVLKNINFNIEVGDTIALVGESGAGKSTLVKLLLRFYDVDAGSIKLDGIDIRDLKISDLRKQIGLVPQDPVLFNNTIGYNIAYAKTDASKTEIENAARQANLWDFINSLKNGLDTFVGERGIKLSGGQKQRLAIARVILENPPVAIFDEATSQLDSENEKQIQAAFNNLTKDKTTIVIAHRLSTIMNADKIVVFDKGQIVESGSHSELLLSTGVYSRLWRLQTNGFLGDGE